MEITQDKFKAAVDALRKTDGSTPEGLVKLVLGSLGIKIIDEHDIHGPIIDLNTRITEENVMGTFIHLVSGESLMRISENTHSVAFKHMLTDLSLKYPNSRSYFKPNSIYVIFSDESGDKEKIIFTDNLNFGIRDEINKRFIK